MLADAVRYHQAGDLMNAESLYRQILDENPDHADALHLIGVIAYQSGNNSLAVEYIQKAITINSSVSFYHNNIGNALLNLNQNNRAVDCFQEAIRLMPENIEAHNNLGNAFRSQGKINAALEQYRKTIQLNPEYAAAYNNAANLLKSMGVIDEAISLYQKAIELMPESAESYFNLGQIYEILDRCEEAAKYFREAIKINADFAEAYNDLGNVLKKQGKCEEAVTQYYNAIKVKPGFAEAYSNLGDTYRIQGEFDEAIDHCQKALKLKQDFALALVNLGNVYIDRGSYNEAFEQYQKAIDIDPELADAHYNKGIVLLMKGEYDQGWREYEWRLKSTEISRDIGYTKSHIPEWDGSHLNGKTILVVSEQGMGDHIQFARYLPMVKERGGRVVFESRRPLMRLFKNYEGIDVLVEESVQSEAGLNPDVRVQLLSLPRIFGTTAGSIFADVPYLKVDPHAKSKWSSLFKHEQFKVGLVWSGSKAHKNDRNRSCSLSDFAPLRNISGTVFYSFQKGGCSMNGATPPDDMQIKDIGKEFDDFYDTAAAIEYLDLLISVDTAVVHLAGALGKRVWTLLPYVPDWRWMLDRNDTPWYPTMRLFRQPRLKDWDSVMNDVADELKKVILKGAHNE
jgi:tetratricopeptide (TPR) repeat protein